MTYQFFNTSNLAFGSKLTKAFLSLTKLANDCDTKCAEVIERWNSYQAYLGKNYLAPRPTSADNPVRSTEIYSLLAGKSIMIEKMQYKNKKLSVILHRFTNSTNRITTLSGETSLTEGYAFIQDAISNQKIKRSIDFVSEASEGKGIQLFQFHIDKDGIINLIDDVSPLLLIPNDITQYTSLTSEELYKGTPIRNYTAFTGEHPWSVVNGEVGVSGTFTYTCPEDMCIIAIGSTDFIRVRRDDTVIFRLQNAYQQQVSCILYAKKDEVYKFDNCRYVLRVKYNQNMPE